MGKECVDMVGKGTKKENRHRTLKIWKNIHKYGWTKKAFERKSKDKTKMERQRMCWGKTRRKIRGGFVSWGKRQRFDGQITR